MALAHFLTAHYPRLDYVVAHLDHGLRPGSAAESRLVADWARAQGLPCVIRREDVAKVAAARKRGVEETGRELRYEFFRAQGRDLIFTAHHADDQAETVLAHLLRGCGLRGLAAIAPRAGDLARPLLCVGKQELLDYCRRHDLPYALDESNADVSYLRNRIRHELLPQLTAINPQISGALCRLAVQARDDGEALDTLADSLFASLAGREGECITLPLEALAAQPPALRRRLVRLAATEVGGAVMSFEMTARVLALDSAKWLPFGEIAIRRCRKVLYFGKITAFCADSNKNNEKGL